jgi:hypothetical protein
LNAVLQYGTPMTAIDAGIGCIVVPPVGVA